MAGLPRVDRHCVDVDADRGRVWQALTDQLGSPSRRSAGLVARLLGCRERQERGRPDQEGATFVGFRVARALPPTELALAGRHRFSRYALTFTVAELAEDRSRLCAVTDAAFPGFRGRAYRALVVGSGMHARTVKAMLERIRHRASEGAT